MDSLQWIRILSMIVFTMNKYSVAMSREGCKKISTALWDINDQRCTICMDCPPGTGYTGIFPCGNGIEGVKGSCERCREGQFQSEHGQLQCTNCTQCINRVVLRNCSHELQNSYDTVCGVCLPGYASLSENSTCVPCSELYDQAVGLPECQTQEQTTYTSPVTTSSYIVPLSNGKVEDHSPPTSLTVLKSTTPPITPYTGMWIVFFLAAAIVGSVLMIVMVVFVYRKTRIRHPSSPSTSNLSRAEVGDENNEDVVGGSGGSAETVMKSCTDGSPDICSRETTPFIGLYSNIGNEGNPSPTSSGYISSNDEKSFILQHEKFPRNARLRSRYERALEISKDARCNRLVTECSVDTLQDLSIELNPHGPFGTKNWRQLGCYLGVPNIIMENYKNLEDPLLNVLKYANAREAVMLDAFLPKLKRVENHKALDVVVGYVLELGKELNSQNDGQSEQLGTGEDTSDLETTC